MEPKELLDQASRTAATYLREAVVHIDEQFGDGFARAHPALVSAFIEASQRDFAAMWSTQEISAALHAIADALRE